MSRAKKFFCFICGNIYEDENRQVGLFHVPKNKHSSWKLVIPELLERSRLCDIHFDKCDVLKGVTVGNNFHPNDRWRLLPTAIPKHFLVKKKAAARSSCTLLKDIFSVTNQDNQSSNYLPKEGLDSCGSTSTAETPGFGETSIHESSSSEIDLNISENVKSVGGSILKPSSIHIIEKSKADEEHPIAVAVCAMEKTKTPEENSINNVIENAKHGMADSIFIEPKKKKCRITLPTNCTMCQKERNGKCSSCEIFDLKQLIKEKDKELKTAKGYQAKSETHLKCLKLKLKENRKKLNTCRKKLLRMRRYGQEVVVTLGNLKEQIETLTAKQINRMKK